MEKEYIIAIIGIGGTIVGTVVGFLSTILYESIKEKRATKSVLQSAINEIQFVTIVNNYPIALNKLRVLIIKHANTINNKELTTFFHKWLCDPMIEKGQAVSNIYRDDQNEKMLSDLSKIKL